MGIKFQPYRMQIARILLLALVLTILGTTLTKHSQKSHRRVSGTDTGLTSGSTEEKRRLAHETAAAEPKKPMTPEEEEKAKKAAEEKKKEHEEKEEEEKATQAIYMILSSSAFFIIYILLASWLRSKGWMKLPSISVLVGFAVIGSWVVYLVFYFDEQRQKDLPEIKGKLTKMIFSAMEWVIAPIFIADSFNEKCLLGARRDGVATFLFGIMDLVLTGALLFPAGFLLDPIWKEAGQVVTYTTGWPWAHYFLIPLILCSTDRTTQAEVQRPLGNAKAFRTLLTSISYSRFLICSSLGFMIWQIVHETNLLTAVDKNAILPSGTLWGIILISIPASLGIGLFGGVALSLMSKWLKSLNEIPMYEMLGITYVIYTIVSACYYHNWLNQMLAILVASAITCSYARFNWSRTTVFHIAYIFQTFAYVASIAINFAFGLVVMGLMAAESLKHYGYAWVYAIAATLLVLLAQIVSHCITGALGCCCKSFLSKLTFNQRVVLILSRQNYGTYFLVAFGYLPVVLGVDESHQLMLWNVMYNMTIISVFATSPLTYYFSTKCAEEQNSKDDDAEVAWYAEYDGNGDWVNKINENCLGPALIRDYKNRKGEIEEIVTEQNKAVSNVMMKNFSYDKKKTGECS